MILGSIADQQEGLKISTSWFLSWRLPRRSGFNSDDFQKRFGGNGKKVPITYPSKFSPNNFLVNFSEFRKHAQFQKPFQKDFEAETQKEKQHKIKSMKIKKKKWIEEFGTSKNWWMHRKDCQQDKVPYHKSHWNIYSRKKPINIWKNTTQESFAPVLKFFGTKRKSLKVQIRVGYWRPKNSRTSAIAGYGKSRSYQINIQTSCCVICFCKQKTIMVKMLNRRC